MSKVKYFCAGSRVRRIHSRDYHSLNCSLRFFSLITEYDASQATTSKADDRDHFDANKPNFKAERKFSEDFSIDQSQLNLALSQPSKTLFNEAIAVNSTAFENVDSESGNVVFMGSKTETALLT